MSQKRNVPSWISSRDPETSPSEPSNNSEHGKMVPESSSNTTGFSKLMEGVAFVLSGFVNPERSTLRSHALAMGAKYQPDWNSDSTLLICAFPNTPKYRQVETNNGTIVSKEWINECYTQKKLVDIEQYLMHSGKPWRKNSDTIREKREHLYMKSEKQVEKKSETKGTLSSSSSKNRSSACNIVKEAFSEVKKWARDDLIQTISWLESQEEKPEAGEIKRIAAEGVLTCLQDAIDSLEQKHPFLEDIESVTELWSFVPRVVKELRKIEKEDSTASKKEVCKQAKLWKEIYEVELAKPDKEDSRVARGYESDETVEMTEEEIQVAYKNVCLKSL